VARIPGLVAVAAAGGAAILALLAGCAVPPDNSREWSTDVRYGDLEAGTCLRASYDDRNELAATFDPNADVFRVVACDAEDAPPIAQVVGVVDIPASSEWEPYGTPSGPSTDEARRWVDGVCRAYGVMVDAWRDGGDRQLTIRANYSIIGDPRLGACIAMTTDASPLDRPVDIDAMRDVVARVTSFRADLPAGSEGWVGSVTDPDVPTPIAWDLLPVGACVTAYPGPDEPEYTVIGCPNTHVAQFVGWVPMPAAWGGAYPDDAEAQRVADEACGAIETTLSALPLRPAGRLVVDAATTSSTAIVDAGISMCWAHREDGGGLVVDLMQVL